MNKLYSRLGVLLALVSIGMGVSSFYMKMSYSSELYLTELITFSIYVVSGSFVLIITLLSKKNPRYRYFAKQFQIMLLYVMGSLDLIRTGEMRAVILFLLGLILAYRYSILKSLTVLITATYNCIMLGVYSMIYRIHIFNIIDKLLFILFTYVLLYIIFSDFDKLIRKRFKRLNIELDLARTITPFGDELIKRISESDVGSVEFTNKEYEVMVAMCFYEKISNGELSNFMNISVSTVKSHLNNIYKKTGIHSRSRLISVYKNIFVDRRIDDRRLIERRTTESED